jgi:hypothetical protein
MFIGPYLWFFEGLGGLSQAPGSHGWKRLRIAPQAYDFWSLPAGASAGTHGLPTVHISSAVWGANCENTSAHEDLAAAMQATCAGKSQCRFMIPNASICEDPPPPPSPPPPKPPASPPTCTTDCAMVALPQPSFFQGSWNHEFANITTEAACKQACLQSPTCVQVTWLVRPEMPCSHYSAISGGWPPNGKITGVLAFLKCYRNESTGQACAPPPPPPPPPPPRPPRRRIFAVNYTCGSDTQPRLATLGPDKGSHLGDGAGVSFTEAAGRELHVDCRPRAAPLFFTNTETVTYQGRVASSWRVFPRPANAAADGLTLCGLVDVNTYGSSLPAASFGSAIDKPAGLTLSCASGVISEVVFASFGQPTGTCGNLSINPHCHNPNSSAVVADLCVGKASCDVAATMRQFGGVDPCPRDGTKLNNGPQRLAVAVRGCHSTKIFELNVTVPVGSQANVVLPAQLLGVDPRAPTTRVSEESVGAVHAVVDQAGDLVVKVGSGSYSFALSAA